MGFSTNGAAAWMLEGRDYPAVDMLFRIVYGFFDSVTGYSKSSRMTTVHAIYILMISTVVAGYWKRIWTREELK